MPITIEEFPSSIDFLTKNPNSKPRLDEIYTKSFHDTDSFEPISNMRFIIARKGGNIVGLLHLYPRHGTGFAIVYDVCVHPGHRRTGIAEAMLMFLKKRWNTLVLLVHWHTIEVANVYASVFHCEWSISHGKCWLTLNSRREWRIDERDMFMRQLRQVAALFSDKTEHEVNQLLSICALVSERNCDDPLLEE